MQSGFPRVAAASLAVLALFGCTAPARAQWDGGSQDSPPQATAEDAAMFQQAAFGAAEPTDYESLARRLEAAEKKLSQLDDEAHHIDTRRIHADGNPHVPSAEQRLAALEKKTGQPPSPSFPSVRLSGFFHLDAGSFNQDTNSRATLGDVQDGVSFRRARLQAVGSVAEFTNYSLEMDFATAGHPSFMDVWGEQTHVPILGNLRIGHYRQPFSMDALSSIRQLDFLERSLPFQALVPFRRVGVMAYDKSDNGLWTWAYGVYRTGGFANAPLGDSLFASDTADNGGASFSARVTHLLYYDEPAAGRYLLHVGGAYNYSRISGGTATGNTYRARAIPEVFIGSPATPGATPAFVDTGLLSADQFNLYGLELAGQAGAAHFQTEFMATTVDQLAGPQVFYDGAYLQGGYFLTGENLTYNKTVGVFDRVVPFTDFFSLGRKSYVGGWGAWEVTGRWSYVNLNDAGAAPAAATPGLPGRLNDVTLGLTWHWNPFSKLQFNWIHCYLDNKTTGHSDTDIFAGRFQVAF